MPDATSTSRATRGTSVTTDKLTARERLLAAADELFYAEGVHTVGIDRVIERAGVAKASLYNSFGSKDELVRAYLRRRQERTSARITAAVGQHRDPRKRLLAVFDSQAASMTNASFNGCAFAAASAESAPDSAAFEVTREYRAWFRALFTDLARDAGARDPKILGRQLQLLYDGCAQAGRLDVDRRACSAAKAAALALLDASTTATG